MINNAYSILRASVTYAVFGGASYDCKEGLGENGVSISFDEDFGERVKGADGSTLWSEYETKSGTVTLEYLANSPAPSIFQNLHNLQRATGSLSQDSLTIEDRDMKRVFQCKDCVIQSITGHTVKKAKGDMITITISCGEISIVSGI